MGERAIQTVGQKVWNEFLTVVQTWLTHHPYIQWAIAHPFWSIALLLIALWLLWGLFGAIARLTEQFWIHLLQVPFRLVQWVVETLSRRVQGLPFWLPGPPPPCDRQEKLKELLHRLETMRQEQDRLLEEVKALLLDQSP